jgi:hypothetical protein
MLEHLIKRDALLGSANNLGQSKLEELCFLLPSILKTVSIGALY